MDIFQSYYEARNEANAEKMAAYMRHRFPFLGLAKPERQALCRDFLKEKKREPDIDWSFVWQSYTMPEREFHYLALQYLLLVKERLRPENLPELQKLIITNSWWDSVDTIDSLVGEIYLNYPEATEKTIRQWMTSENIWLKRISIDFQLGFKEKTNTVLLKDAILQNTDTGEFFVNKAIGWALRAYSKVNPDWVRQFLNENEVSPLSKKEASKYLSV